jgi:hypothetical protein
VRCRIAPELVGDHPPGHTALTFQQLSEEAFSGTPIAARLEQDVDHVAVLVDRTPETVLLTPDVHEEFIQVPRIAQRPCRPLSLRAYAGPNFRHHCRMVS